jgi:hypothetical protein
MRIARRRDAAVKGHGAVVGLREDSVGRHDVEMHEDAEGGVETLDEGHTPRLGPRESRGGSAEPAYLFDEDAIARRQGVRAKRHHAADFEGRRQHPLPHRRVGQDAIDEVRRRPAHAARRARRARASALARHADEDFLPAHGARHADEAVRQDAAPDVAPQLVFDVLR